MVERFSEFDASKVGEALGAEPRTMRDVAHGDGEALTVGEAVLEVYRDAGVARVTTADARIELFRVPDYTISGERVVFEQGDQDNRSRLQVRADGKVAFHPVLRATELSTANETAGGGRQDSPALTTTPERTTTTANTIPPTAERQELPQLQLQGRLGRDPWYSDQGDEPAAGFPLAVNNDQGQTTWHRVVVFGETAQQLHEARTKGQIKKGRLVDVTGQIVVREEPKASGGVRKTAELHATSVARVTTRPAR
jgi:hypothetical protein